MTASVELWRIVLVDGTTYETKVERTPTGWTVRGDKRAGTARDAVVAHALTLGPVVEILAPGEASRRELASQLAALRRRLETMPPWDFSEVPTDEEMRALRLRWATGPERYQADADLLFAAVFNLREKLAAATVALDSERTVTREMREATAFRQREIAALLPDDPAQWSPVDIAAALVQARQEIARLRGLSVARATPPEHAEKVNAGVIKQVFYFGCWGHIGHYLWTPEKQHVRFAGPFSDYDLDSRFCPGMDSSRRGVGPIEQPEGMAALHHERGWTVLSFWDRTVDTRGGSHSTYVMEGDHDFQSACAIARLAFHEVWTRYTFTVRMG